MVTTVTDVAGAPAEPAVVEHRVAVVAAPSMRRHAASRLVADTSGLVFGVASGIATARVLGPSGEGLFSSLVLLSSVIMWVSALGLGDAAVYLVGQRRVTVQKALSVTVTLSLGLSVVAAAVLWAASIVVFRDNWGTVRSAAIVASLVLPLTLFGYELNFLLSAQERVSAQSAVVAATSVLTGTGLIVFVAVIRWGLVGAIVGTACGGLGGLALAVVLLQRGGLSFRLAHDGGYARAAVRYGLPVCLSYVLGVAVGRVDLVLTYLLAGAKAAGWYSIALSFGNLVTLPPVAISAATFPRLAKVEPEEAAALTAEACRYGVAAAMTATVVLLAGVPVALPVALGHRYVPAIGATLVILPGGILVSAQWLLSRAAAAMGRPGLLGRSFAVALAVMCSLDFLLIPAWGIRGGALAADAGPLAGLVVCLVSYHRWQLLGGLTEFLPGPRDFKGFFIKSLLLLPGINRRLVRVGRET